MHKGMPHKYRFSNIAPELSVAMFEDHWKLYESYVLRLNDVLKELSNPYDPELVKQANPVSGKLRELEADKSFLTNAVLLHELFFENVILPDTTAPMAPGPQTMSIIQRDLPQVKASDFWEVIVKPKSKAARGWCVVGMSMLQGKLEVAMLDSHAGVLPIGLYPLLVIDMYEHAYSEQYGIDRGTYLDHLKRSINWSIVEHRLAMVMSASEMMRTSVPEEAEEYIREHYKDDTDLDFGFPGEDDFPEDKPASRGLDHRNELSVQPNPRAVSFVEGAVTKADLVEAHDRIKHLSKISFKSDEDMFDEVVKGKSSAFKSELWAMLQEDTE